MDITCDREYDCDYCKKFAEVIGTEAIVISKEDLKMQQKSLVKVNTRNKICFLYWPMLKK